MSREALAEVNLLRRAAQAWYRWAVARGMVGGGTPASTHERAMPVCRKGPSATDQAAEITRLRRELDRLRKRDSLLDWFAGS